MSDYLESLFKGVDILIDKKLESLAYDTTDICTITDNSESKNGKYRVTDGSVSYIAYSDTDNFKVGDQVRVNIPNNDYTQQKFIVGKYTSEDSTKPITYVSPLDNVVNITGNLTKILGNSAFGIIANGATRKRILWNQTLQPELFRDLRANGIYDTLILKADFKTNLASFNYVEGSYGLIIDLLITPSPGSPIKIKRSVELSSKEMFGNPYNFAIYSPQEKAFSITTSGVIEGIELSIYQNGDFKDSKGNYPVDRLENIFVKNIEIGFGSNILNVEDNVVRIYSENGLAYRNKFHSASTNLKKMGLVWYNKDEVNRYVGFSDGVYSQSYDELEYLEKVHQDTRLLEQQGRDNMPYDELGLTFAANIAESIPALTKVLNILTQDLYTEINYLMTKIPPDSSMYSAFETLSDTITDNAMAAEGVILELKQFYNDILIYACKRQNGLDATMPNLSTNYYEKFFNILKNITTSTVDASTDISISDCLSWILGSDVIQAPALGQGYNETYNNFIARVGRLIDKAQSIINNLSIVNSSKVIQEFNSIITYVTNLATNGNYYKPYTEKDLSQYDNKYCIYWYRYEDGYVDESDEYKLMPEGWRKLTSNELKEHHPLKKDYVSTPSKRYANNKGELILNAEGKATHDIQCSSEEGFVYRYMQHDWKEEKYVAVVFYNHEMYRSNELVFTNQDAVADIDTLDKSDALKFEHISYSTDAYYLYNEMFLLKDAMDSRRQREIRCRYDGRRAKDEALNGADIYWYVPLTSTMITYDKQYLIEQGFDTDDGNKFHYSKDGYICFYKRASGEQKKNAENILEWDFRQVLTESEENPTYGPDTRSFWYQIKPRLESNTVNNHILCAVAPAGETETVESIQLFAFGLGGTNGTAYTFAIDNATSLQTAITDDNSLLLNISIRNGNNQLVPLKADQNVSVQWDSYGGTKKLSKNEIDLKYEINSLTIENGRRWGVLDARATLHLENKEHPDKGRKIILDCQYPVPWSAKLGYRLSGGDIYIAYTNAGTLNSLTTFDEPFKIIEGLIEVEVDSWEIKPYKMGTEGLEEITEPSASASQTEKNAWNFYSQYCPKLDPENRLIPSPLFLSDANFVPVLIAYKEGSPIFIQPIVLMQSQYPSQLLNDWDGKLQINDKNGTILSSLVGAGRKNESNAFNGILMGDIALEAGIDITQNMGMGIMSGIGLYGFHDGAQSFGFNINGQAFIGKAGGARIFFDGNAGFIASANWFTGGGTVDRVDGITKSSTMGMCIDLVNGHLDAFNFKLSSDNITLNSHPTSDEYYFSMGNEEQGIISLDAKGNMNISVSTLSIRGLDTMVNESVSDAMSDFEVSQSQIFDTLYTDPLTGDPIQGIDLINGKVYVSAEIMQTGILKSANFNGRLTSGAVGNYITIQNKTSYKEIEETTLSSAIIFDEGTKTIGLNNQDYVTKRVILTKEEFITTLWRSAISYVGKSRKITPGCFLCQKTETSSTDNIVIDNIRYKIIGAAALGASGETETFTFSIKSIDDIRAKMIYPESVTEEKMLELWNNTSVIVFQSTFEKDNESYLKLKVTANDTLVTIPEDRKFSGMCINLNTGGLYSSALTLDPHGVMTGILGGWILDQVSLSYNSASGGTQKRQVPMGETASQNYYFKDGNNLNLGSSTGSQYYKWGYVFLNKVKKIEYNGQTNSSVPSLLFFDSSGQIKETIHYSTKQTSTQIDLSSYKSKGATLCIVQIGGSSPSGVSQNIYVYEEAPYCSSLFGEPPEYADSPIFYLGAPEKPSGTVAWEYWKSLMCVCKDGSIYMGYSPNNGFISVSGASISFQLEEFAQDPLMTMELQSTPYLDKTVNIMKTYEEFTFMLNGKNDTFKFCVNDASQEIELLKIFHPKHDAQADSCILHTKGDGNTYGAIEHQRDNDISKFGLGAVYTQRKNVTNQPKDENDNSFLPSVSIELLDMTNHPQARLDVLSEYAWDELDWTASETNKKKRKGRAHLMVRGIGYHDTYKDNRLLWSEPLTFGTDTIWYGGTWENSGALGSSSVERIKRNIVKVDNALHFFEKDQSEIYSYNLINSSDRTKSMLDPSLVISNDVVIDNRISYGFVIGEKYKVPQELLTDNKESIDLYSMISLNWKATQELYELYKKLSAYFDNLNK